MTVPTLPSAGLALTPAELVQVAHRFRETTHVVALRDGRVGAAVGDEFARERSDGHWTSCTLAPMYPEWLGDRGFNELHGTRFPYIVGEMANGIATTRMVRAAADAGCLGIFGAAGLEPGLVAGALTELSAALGTQRPWGSNLIHSPNEPELEHAVSDLYTRHDVRCVTASAFMSLTPAVVRCALAGVHVDRQGAIQRPRRLVAKLSRPEVAQQFMNPAPAGIVEHLVGHGLLTRTEAQLAARLPVAEDLTIESDSGGHTDNRPLSALLPTIARLRDDIVAARDYERPIRVGAAGGLGTPGAVAAAFALGAAYVVTGSVNQACLESGLHADARAMLAEAGIADVAMAPAADMFELGVDVQVLKRGTMFAVRARRLYELYRAYASLADLPAKDREWLEGEVLRADIGQAWEATRAFWEQRDASQVRRAEADARVRMALVFRSYLGQASRWAMTGQFDRRIDYQIWCGPAMGAFNAWTAGSFLADPAQRTVGQVAANLLEGATAISRAQHLRTYGVPVPAAAYDFRPRPLH